MGLRTSIQARLIALFKVDQYEIVTYANGIPSVGHGTETPKVVCNETSAGIVAGTGHSTTYTLDGWAFDLICDFKNEVDYSDFIDNLENLSYAVDNDHLAEIVIGSTVIVEHPPQQGTHNGTQLRFGINVDIKR